MPGFGPVGSAPVGAVSDGPPPPPSLKVSEQSAQFAFTQPGLIVTEQSAQFAFTQPGLIVTEQSAYVVFLVPSVPPVEPVRRRQYVLM